MDLMDFRTIIEPFRSHSVGLLLKDLDVLVP